MKTKIKLVQLKGFCSVMQNPNYSITETAKKIFVEQSALSRQILSLEKELGISLFDRSKHKKIKPTNEAHLFYKKAIGYMNGIEGLIGDFKEELKGLSENNLNIALHKGVATSIFPTILEKMLKIDKFKNLNVNIYSISKDEAIKKLIDKEIDLAFYIQDSRDELPIGLETIKSMRSRAYLVFNKLHPLTKKEIITKEDIEKYKIIERNTKTKSYNNVYSHFNTKASNIRIIGSASSEIALEIVKYNNEVIATVSEIFLNNGNCQDMSNIEVRDIEYLVDGAFFHVIKLKDSYLSKPASWIISEFKKLKNI